MELDNIHNNVIRDNTNLIIWQQNVNKSRICQHDLLSSARLIEKQVDIIALQEPSISDFSVTIATKDWRVLYPTMHAKDPSKTRTVTLIRADIHTNNWSQVEFNSGDVTVVKLKGIWGSLLLLNVYNDCEHDLTVEQLKSFQKRLDDTEQEQQRVSTHTIWLGDFNRHHPHWDNTSDTRLFTKEALGKAEKLISAVADAGLDFALPPKIPTHKHSVTKKWTRLDQVFISEHSLDSLLSCEVITDNYSPNTDHLPIVTNLDLSLAKTPTKCIANFRNVDWDEFRRTLEGRLREFGLPTFITNQGQLDEECNRLTTALQSTIQEVVPTTELGPMSRRWWMKELNDL